MPLIALTGGIASGKSTIAARLAQLGAEVVDADAIAREVVEPGTPGLAAVVDAFGPDVLTPDGRLDRPALGRLVFGDEAARHRLNGIVHPLVLSESRRRMAAALAHDPDRVVVYDVPLIDARGTAEFDVVLVADASEAVRLRRLVELRGMDEAEAHARIAAQLGDAERRALADEVIDTGGTLEHTLAQAGAFMSGFAAGPALD